MSERFCGIDPPALADLALQLDWIAADIDVQTSQACGQLTRHSHWTAADRAGTQLAHTARWARLSADDLSQRAGAIAAAQTVGPWGSLRVGDSWWRRLGPLAPPRPLIPGFDGINPRRLFGDTKIPWGEVEDWVRGALGIWNGRQDKTFPIGRWVAGLLYVNRVAGFLRKDRAVPTVANGWVVSRLAGTRHLRWLNSPAVQTVGRRASIGLGAFSTISDGIVVYNHGNPIEAFEHDGAGYVSDVARLGFSASTTAFLVAPNPLTGGVVIVTGVVWAGAEVFDHWDEVAEFWGETYADLESGAEWLYDEIGEAQDWANYQATAVEDWTRRQLDHVSHGWDWTANLGSGLAGEVVAVAEDLADGFAVGVDDAGERLDGARTWAGGSFDDLFEVGGGFVDGGLDIGRKVIAGW